MNPIFGRNPEKALAVARALGVLQGPENPPEERALAVARAALAREPFAPDGGLWTWPGGGIVSIAWRVGPIVITIAYRISAYSSYDMLHHANLARGLLYPLWVVTEVEVRGSNPERARTILTAALKALDPNTPSPLINHHVHMQHILSARADFLYTALSEAAGGEDELATRAYNALVQHLAAKAREEEQSR